MSNRDNKVFDLDVRRPQVLLLGNGLTYSTGVPWPELILKVAKDSTICEKYVKKKNSVGKVLSFHVPNTVLTLATSETDDIQRHQKYGEALQCSAYAPNV